MMTHKSVINLHTRKSAYSPYDVRKRDGEQRVSMGDGQEYQDVGISSI